MYPQFDAYYTELAARRETNAPEPPTVPVTVSPRDLDAIYSFWFGVSRRSSRLEPERVRYWMQQSDDTDAEVRRRFAHLLPVAARVQWDLGALSPRQRVGLVVLLDQFPRNLFRTTGEAFAYDELARDIASKLSADLHGYTVAERFILGLPFVHQEDMAGQDFAVMIAAREAVAAADDEARQQMRLALDQAIRHRDLIRRFGRFPHRNAMLGRTSTPEETAFMAEHGRGF